ncbi:MAG: oligosaccharide flippase family protein [Pseudomonadota bacterium]
MTPIKKNIVANYAGSIWIAAMSVIFIPVYIKFMGIEAYGLVGVFGSLLALFAVIDFGLKATMVREMARLAAKDPTGKEARSLARTLEIIYWGTALLLGIIVVSMAGPVTDYWINPDTLNPATVRQALMIIGAVIALHWPVSFYSGGLRGLDRQPLLNVIHSAAATFRGLGAVAVLWLISPTIQAFFTWQIVVSALETSSLAAALWVSLPGRGGAATFSAESLRKVWRFSAGMTGISILAVVLMQADKVILTKMLSLKLFGYYTLGWTASWTLLRLVGPIDSAVYPTITRLAAQDNENELAAVYHKSCQSQAVVIVPATLTLVLFGDIVLTVWSGNTDLVANAGPVVRVLSIAVGLNAFIRIPHLAMLAHGWTSLIFYQNLFSVIALVPLMVVLATWYQAVGAAWVWVIFTSSYVLITIQIMHRHILRKEKWKWYVRDIGTPTVATLAVFASARVIMPGGMLIPLQAVYVLAVAGAGLLAAVLATDFPRSKFLELIGIVFRKRALRMN